MTEQHPVSHRHRDVSGGWLRPTVFGVSDGLVSNFALIAGVAGGDVGTHAVTLAGLAGLASGAFSMATGEYVSVRSQRESMVAEIDIERQELLANPAGEAAELAARFEHQGVQPELARDVAAQISTDPEQALEIHARDELGVSPTALPNPWLAAVSSFFSFVVGAFVPLSAYLFGADSILLATVLACAGLFAVGAATAEFTNRTWWYAGTRQLVLGGGAAALTFGVGTLFGHTG